MEDRASTEERLSDVHVGDGTVVRLPARYEVGGLLGRGGMAVVYRARDMERDIQVAVKILRPEVVGVVAVERFLREIRHQTLIHDDRIVPVLDAGEADGLPYYVLPFYPDGTLRRLLERGPLSWGDTVRLVADVATALDASHAAGVLHRDIKPENVLLDGERARLSDFGIARALEDAGGDRLTASGVSLGTPGYMSPEQSDGSRALDARSDVYALACLAYECIAGELPFTGPSRMAIAAKQATLPVPSLRVVRTHLAPAVDDVFRRALARVPADRFPSAGAFADALSSAGRARTMRVPRRASVVVGLGVAAVVLWLLTQRAVASRQSGEVAETNWVLVRTPGVSEDAAAVVRSALGRWNDVQVIERVMAVDQLPADAAGAGALMRREAGRNLLILREWAGDSAGWRLGHGRLAGGAVDYRAVPASSDLVPLIDSLLLGGTDDPEARPFNVRPSLLARHRHAEGRRAMARWDLIAADSAFRAAAELDTLYMRPRLHLALVRAWQGVDPARWRIPAEQAAAGSRRLPPAERLMAQAVVHEVRADLERACPLWESVVKADTLDPRGWFGAARCHAADDAVIRDARSPSGYRFRSSYHRALQEYQRAFLLHPAILTSFSEGTFESLRRLFKTSGAEVRRGRGVNSDQLTFTANHSWQGDTLGFIPYPKGATALHVSRNRPALNEALRHQRELVRDVVSTWVANYPESPDAWQAMALSVAVLGDPAALDTLARARRLLPRATQRERDRVAAAEVALQLAFGAGPADTVKMKRVRHLADSLLAAGPNVDPLLQASMAALTGRAGRLSQLASTAPVAAALAIPAPLRRDVPALLVLGALGGPGDSLAVLEARVRQMFARSLRPADLPARRAEFLARAASLAFPAWRSPHLETYGREGDPLCAAQAAWVRGDTGAVQSALAAMATARREVLPESIQLDALAPEAALLFAIGDWAGVEGWVAPTLDALPHEAPRLVSSPLRAASIVRTMMVRASAAVVRGDPGARRMMRAVEILWSAADGPLQQAVGDLRGMRDR